MAIEDVPSKGTVGYLSLFLPSFFDRDLTDLLCDNPLDQLNIDWNFTGYEIKKKKLLFSLSADLPCVFVILTES